MKNKYPKRRKLLTMCGVLPVWATPLVTSVMLPVHAQTSSPSLIDVTPPPPGFVFCAQNESGSIESLFVQLQNIGTAQLTLESIAVTADIGSVIWKEDVALPITISAGSRLDIQFIPSPTFICTSNQNPTLTVTYTTNIGTTILKHQY